MEVTNIRPYKFNNPNKRQLWPLDIIRIQPIHTTYYLNIFVLSSNAVFKMVLFARHILTKNSARVLCFSPSYTS